MSASWIQPERRSHGVIQPPAMYTSPSGLSMCFLYYRSPESHLEAECPEAPLRAADKMLSAPYRLSYRWPLLPLFPHPLYWQIKLLTSRTGGRGQHFPAIEPWSQLTDLELAILQYHNASYGLLLVIIVDNGWMAASPLWTDKEFEQNGLFFIQGRGSFGMISAPIMVIAGPVGGPPSVLHKSNP